MHKKYETGKKNKNVSVLTPNVVHSKVRDTPEQRQSSVVPGGQLLAPPDVSGCAHMHVSVTSSTQQDVRLVHITCRAQQPMPIW